jgi:hypothetical protein
MSRPGKSQPRPLLGLFLLAAGGGALFIGAYLLLGSLNGLTGGGADAEFRSLSSVFMVAGLLLALPGAIAAWAGWRLLTR